MAEKILTFRQWAVNSFYVPAADGAGRDYSALGMKGLHASTGKHFNCAVPIWMLTAPLLEEWLKIGGKELEGAVPDFDQIDFKNGKVILPMHTKSGLKMMQWDIVVPPRPNWQAMHEAGASWKGYDRDQYHPEVATKLAYFYARGCNGHPEDHWKSCGCPPFHKFELGVNVRIDDWYKRLG